MSVALFKQAGDRQVIALAAAWSGAPLTFKVSGCGSFRVHNSASGDAQVCVCDDLPTATAPANRFFTLGPNESIVLRGFQAQVYANAQAPDGSVGNVEFVPGA